MVDLQQQLAAHALSEQQLKAEYQSRIAQLMEQAGHRAARERELEDRSEELEELLRESRGREAAVGEQLARLEHKSSRLEEER